MGAKAAGLSTRQATSLTIGRHMADAVTTDRYAVMISGASFAGLALACGLEQALGPELGIALVDRSAGPGAAKRDSRASALSAGSKRMLEALGVWTALAEEA